ncbi:hypothetical protein [Jiangella sp. DSM 45060]|uniref:hypothetical protein n=1 Tax=Jiangella sp. DSM 45060 TaxID=1798224 RepID=UPI00087D5484|nr:hypothetical protein [Jiangella sp. DSM 45060]SDS30709.1 hypothetical protein SAMN04515669_0801 [Jiangella sp. DSM 45060]
MTFSSVSVTGLEDLVAKLQIARREMDDFLGYTTERSVRADMNRLDVTSTGFDDLAVVHEWVESALQETQRRLGLARAIQHQQPNAPMVQIEENATTDLEPGLAERQGRDLATRVKEAGEVDADMMEELEQIAYDPDAMAGFYAELGPEMAARLAASMGMPESGVGENAQEYLKLLSIGLGTAMMDETPPEGMSAFSEFGLATDDPQVAWGRLALLQYGDFSGQQAFVEQTVNGTALDAFSDKDWADPNNISTKTLGDGDTAVGLTEDITALAFNTLARYPGLATKVLSEQDISAKELTHRVYAAAGDPAQRADLADSFGLAIEAATGSQGDPPNTEHTPEQAALAFEFITGSADHQQIPPAIKDSTARIAAAYVDELVAGSFIDGGEMPGDRGSSMTGVPADFPQGTGLSPDFYLSPRAVHRFLGGFQDQIEYSAPFEVAVESLYNSSLADAIAADKADGGNRVNDVMSLFGAAATLYFEGQREFAADFDEREKARKGAVAKIFTEGTGAVLPPGLGFWLLHQGVGGKLDQWANSTNTEGAVIAENTDAAQLRWYMTVHAMIGNGVGSTPESHVMDSAPDAIKGQYGELLPMDQIYGDPELRRQFMEWVQSVPALDDMADAGTDAWDSGWQGAQTFLGRT